MSNEAGMLSGYFDRDGRPIPESNIVDALLGRPTFAPPAIQSYDQPLSYDGDLLDLLAGRQVGPASRFIR